MCEWLRLSVVATTVDLVPDGFVDGRAGPVEEGTRDGARRGRRESTQAGFPALLAPITAGGHKDEQMTIDCEEVLYTKVE